MTTSTQDNVRAEYAQNGWGGRGDLNKLADELNRQKQTKIDFVADTRQLCSWYRERDRVNRFTMMPCSHQTNEFIDKDGIEVNDAAFGQLLAKASPPIPVRYGRKLLAEQPGACVDLTGSTFFKQSSRRLFRCLDGRVRAVLSDKYRFVDHYDLAFTALEVVQQNDGEVFEAALDEKRMRLKFTSKKIVSYLKATREGDRRDWYYGGLGSPEFLGKVGAKSQGDLPGGPNTVHPAVTISNSETGHGGISVRLGIMQGVCFNLATVETVVKDIHLGGKLDDGIYSDETRAADSQAIFLKARDAIKAAFTPAAFEHLILRIRESTQKEIAAPSAAVNMVAERLDLDETKRDAILQHFVRDYAPTAAGLASAVTRAAQDEDHPEVAEEFESFAGELLSEPDRMLQGVC